MTAMFIGLSLLVAIEPEKPNGKPVAELPATTAPEIARGEALARYNELKAKMRQTADAHWKLGVWCEENHLEPEAFVHFTNVAMLAPNREAAWRKLGYKKHQGQWRTEAQIADSVEQDKADKDWKVRLKKIHHDIHGKRNKKKVDPTEAVRDVVDPRSVPAVFREFGQSGKTDQLIAIQILGQIESPLASKLLAVLAIYGKTPDVRRRATETLRQRNPDEYLAILVNLLRDPVRYEVRPVAGPGSTGVLYIEGERSNHRRFYDAPIPSISFQPGDTIVYDQNGRPGLFRPWGILASKVTGVQAKPGKVPVTTFLDTDFGVRVSQAEIIADARKGAMSAQLQLETDIAQIEALNEVRKGFNESVIRVASFASGKDLGNEPKEWRDAVFGRGRYRKEGDSARKPTLEELVPLAYLPRFGELTVMNVPRMVSGDG